MVYTLECAYGNNMDNVCPQRAMNHLEWQLKSDKHIIVTRVQCNGCPLPCPSEGGMSGTSTADVGDTYELAVSDDDGPYEVIATLTDADWLGGEWDWVPTVPMTAARLRMRDYDGTAALIDEVETYETLNIEPVSNVGVEAAFAFTLHPNPGCRGTISLNLSDATCASRYTTWLATG